MGNRDRTGRKPMKGVFSSQLPLRVNGLLTLEGTRRKQKASTFELSHPRSEGAVVFAHQTSLVRWVLIQAVT